MKKDYHKCNDFDKNLSNGCSTNSGKECVLRMGADICGDFELVKGTKLDVGKPDWSLLPIPEIDDMIKVMTYGVKKYSRDNWQKVPDAKNRYTAAFYRHVGAWKEGEINDPESGLPHLAHALCCLTYLMWFDDNEQIGLGEEDGNSGD